MQENSLSGKMVLITGASRGIGKACAFRLAAAGANIAINYQHDKASAEQVCLQLIQDHGVEAIPLQADVSKLEQVEEMFSLIKQRWGRLDILVNNAGIHRDGLLLRMKPEDWDAVIATNLNGLFYCTKQAAKMMLKQKSGRIVNIASVVGLIGNEGQANYAATKAGVLGFTKSVALELAPRQIAVNAVAPGYIDSEMTQGLSEEKRQNTLKKIPFGRFGKCSEVAEVVLFLSSDRCQFMTGQTINIDGGMVMK